MNIFVSRPTWVDSKFDPGLQHFLTQLRDEYGLNPRTLGSTDYPTKSPLDEVIRILKDCRGIIVLGYPQIEIDQGRVKGSQVTTTILPTEWNHIEAAIAYSMSLPLLVIHHIGICRGIFDRGALNAFLFEKDLSAENWGGEEEIVGALQTWKDEVLGSNPTPVAQRSTLEQALTKDLSQIWTITTIGRRLEGNRSVGREYRERAEGTVTEVNEFYVRLYITELQKVITVPIAAITISFDDNRNRPKLELRG